MPSAPPRRANPRWNRRERSREAEDWHALYNNAAWRRASKAYLSEHPLCVDPYGDHGPLVPSTCTDHVIPHRGDLDLFWDQDNWQALCKPCNSKKCVTEEGGWGNMRRKQ